MLTVFVMIVVLVALACVVVKGGLEYRASRKQYERDGRETPLYEARNSFFDYIIILFIAIAACFGTVAYQYNAVLKLPIDLAAITRTISEQESYVLGRDANIGAGLEGIEIKLEISRNVSKRNEMIARIEYINISPWWMFRVRQDKMQDGTTHN